MSNNLLNFFEELDEEEISKTGNSAEVEWQGMPEFVQDKEEPYAKIIVRFSWEEDLLEFGKLIGQKVNPKTKSIWHPALEHGKNAGLRWVDEE